MLNRAHAPPDLCPPILPFVLVAFVLNIVVVVVVLLVIIKLVSLQNCATAHGLGPPQQVELEPGDTLYE